jgi:hypothetical protein
VKTIFTSSGCGRNYKKYHRLTLRDMISEAVQNLDVVIHDLHADAATAAAADDIGSSAGS